MRIGPRVGGSLIATGVVVAATLGVGVISGLVERDGAFEIDRFDQQVRIEADGSTQVLEDLDVTFTAERRGIFRDFDTGTDFPSIGGFRDLTVDRGDPSEPWNARVEPGPSGPRLRIGQEDVYLDPGTYRYRIGYSAPSWFYALEDEPDMVEVRIDSPGFDWPTDIGASSLTVEVPGEVRDAACVEGPRGTTSRCETEPQIDGNVAVFTAGPFRDQEGATVALWVDRAAFDEDAAVFTYDPIPLDSARGTGVARFFGAPWPLERPGAALVLVILLAVPILVWEKLSAWAVYRDRVTDPALHDREHPTAVPAPPFAFRPPEIAGLQLRQSDDQLFLATLVDLDQRDLIITRSETVPGGRFTKDTEKLTVTLGPGIADAHPHDAEVVHALLPGGDPIVFDGKYDEAVAERVDKAQMLISAHASTVFETHGFTHSQGGLLAKNGFRNVMSGGYLVYAAAMVWLVTASTPLHLAAGGIIGVLVLMGWGLNLAIWRHHRLPLNSEGRDATAQTRSFEKFLRTVEREQLEWAAGQPGVDHHHPAISLLPYAIALGLADSWYDRFSGVMQELAVAARADGGGGRTTTMAGTSAWWASSTSFSNVRSAQSGTSTAPSSSGGSGGGGSGGGGGGGGSW